MLDAFSLRVEFQALGLKTLYLHFQVDWSVGVGWLRG